MISVVNRRTYGKPKNPWEVYIGRPNKRYGFKGSILQNGFYKGSRVENIDNYEQDMRAMPSNDPRWKELHRLREIHAEHGKLVLVCFCFPLTCHGDVVKAMIEELDEF